MKKANWILTFFVALISLFASCKKEKQDSSKQMIGVWKGNADPNSTAAPFEINFAENGKITDVKWGNFLTTVVGSESQWSVSGSSLTFQFKVTSIAGIDQATGTGTINGTTVSGTFTNSHIYGSTIVSTGSFTLVKQ